MPTTNNNKQMDMKQLWQQMEPAVTASSALSAMTSREDGTDRYFYYIIGAAFFRYDTIGNCWHKLAAPLVTPTVFASMRYSKYSGTFGRVISATAQGAKIPGLYEGVYTGNVINIISGTGAGQKRTITACGMPRVYEQGVATTASVTAIGDSTKKWKFNQWEGYQVRLTYSTGQTQVRKILYNDATTLTVSDANYQPIDPFNNAPFVIAPVTTAGAQTSFVIEASDITVDSPWTTQPDATSRFKIESGGIWLFTSAATPFASIQYYDVAGDYWVNKTVPTGIFLAAFGTDGTIERTGEIGGVYETGTAESGSAYVLTDTGKAMTRGQYRNFRIRITGGTGVGQSRRIVNNGTDYFEVAKKWDTNPGADSVYEVLADKDKIYMMGNAQSFIFQYDVDSDLIIQGSKYDDGIASNLAARYPGVDTPNIAINTGVRNTGGITVLNPTPTAGGTNYLVGDILTITTGGTNGKAIVTAIAPGGIVTAVSLMRPGSGYTTGSAKATSGGSGTLCTLDITTTGVVCYVTTAINHRFEIGDTVTLSGDAAYAGAVTIIGCDALNTFDFATAAAGNMTAAFTNSATVIVDCTKNWTVNEHAGKIIQTHLTGLAGTVQPRLIISNTATTITVATITTALVNGTGRYVIIDNAGFGRDEQYKTPERHSDGYATGGTTASLIDSTKNWYPNQWLGARLRFKTGAGRDTTVTITSNTETTLNYTTQTFTPDATTLYYIQDTFGNCTGAGSTTTIVDTTKRWAVNQWAGKKVRLSAGTSFGLTASANEILIVSNTIDTLTFAAITGLAPDATTCYTILAPPPRGAGIELQWAFGGASNGRYLYAPRGGINAIDRYDITTEEWDYPIFYTPQTDVMGAGSYWAYDGLNRIYFSPAVATSAVQYVYYLDLTTHKVYGIGSVPNIQGAAAIGNRMEIMTSPQGIDYIYHLMNTGVFMYRAQLFF